MNYDYDVIVVGGGPGGSAAATVAAQKGLRTLVVDRDQFPREKACGDAVPISCFRILREMGFTAFGGEEFFHVNQIVLRGPHRSQLKFTLTQEADIASCIVPRYKFDNELLQFAQSCGAEYEQFSVTAPIVENEQVIGIKGKQGNQIRECYAKVIIAADGATSVIARQLGVPARKDDRSAVALRAYIESSVDLDPTIEFVFLADIPGGYAWFFPLSKRTANIGVGMRSDFYKRQNKTLKEMLDYYCSLEMVHKFTGNNKPENVKTWQIPIFTFDRKRRFNGALLVGDAGDFVNPLTGAGIYTAIVTGKYAAEVANDAIKSGNLSAEGLAQYDLLWEDRLGGDLRRANTMHNIVSVVPTVIDALVIAAKIFPPLVPRLLGKI